MQKKISLLLIQGPARKSVELNCLKLWGSWGYFLCESIVFTRKITITSVWEGALSLGKQGKHLCRNIRVLSNFLGTFGVCSVLTMNMEICPWAWSSPPLMGLNWFLRHLIGSTVWESLLVWATATPTYHLETNWSPDPTSCSTGSNVCLCLLVLVLSLANLGDSYSLAWEREERAEQQESLWGEGAWGTAKHLARCLPFRNLGDYYLVHLRC